MEPRLHAPPIAHHEAREERASVKDHPTPSRRWWRPPAALVCVLESGANRGVGPESKRLAALGVSSIERWPPGEELWRDRLRAEAGGKAGALSPCPGEAARLLLLSMVERRQGPRGLDLEDLA